MAVALIICFISAATQTYDISIAGTQGNWWGEAQTENNIYLRDKWVAVVPYAGLMNIPSHICLEHGIMGSPEPNYRSHKFDHTRTANTHG